MRGIVTGCIAAAIAAFAFSATEANARFYTPKLEAPSLVEEAACRVRRVRTVRPNGRVVVRTVRTCSPVERCRVVRERIHRPNGNIVIRTVRRCR